MPETSSNSLEYMPVPMVVRVYLAKKITERLRERIVENILPPVAIDTLEKMLKEERDPLEQIDLLPDGSVCISRPKVTRAMDLVETVFSAIEEVGFRIVKKEKSDDGN